MNCGRFSLLKKKRYVKNIWIGDPYDPYGLPIRMTIRINNPYDLYGSTIRMTCTDQQSYGSPIRMTHTNFFIYDC